MKLARTSLAAAALALTAVTAGAQASTPAPAKNVLSIQPLNAVYGVYSGEFEHAVASNKSLSLGVSYWGASHEETNPSTGSSYTAGVDYLSFDSKYRYYPNHALRGFSFAGSLGFSRLSGDVGAKDSTGTSSASGSLNAIAAGMELSYSWLLGKEEKFHIGTGIGAKKLFPMGDNSGITLAYPTMRISVGYAF